MIFIRWFAAVTALAAAAACTRADGGAALVPVDPGPQGPHLPPSPTPDGPVCSPGAGPAWVLEGETLTFPVSCTSGMALADAQISLKDLPAGATFDETSGVLTWTPGLDQAAVYVPTLEVAATGESVPLKIGVADAWERGDNVPIADPARYTEEYGMPVFFLQGVPTDKDYIPATVVHGGKTYSIEAKVRGDASFSYPKRHFTLSFPKEDKFQEPSRHFVGKRKVNLHSGFDDNSHVRNHLAFELWNAMDPGHIRVQSYPAVLYLDGAYWGHYTVIDHIDGFLMEDHGYTQDGDMFKPVDHTVDWTTQTPPHDGFEKTGGLVLPPAPGAWADLDELIRFVDGSSDAEFRDDLDTFLDVRDYQDWWVFVMLVYGEDSVAKNNYHFEDAGPFRFIPWDYNASFGQNWRTVRRDPGATTEFLAKNRLFERLHADPTFRAEIRDRYTRLLDSRVPKETFLQWVDSYAAEIEASARRDERRWKDAYRTYSGWADRTDFLTWEEEVAYVRAWAEQRWDNQRLRYANPGP